MRTHAGYFVYMKKIFTVREARASFAEILDQVAQGAQVVITRRGKPIARMIPESGPAVHHLSPYPLRGSVLSMRKDFDEPLPGRWEALEK
jgi:prevent-host-death family protein